MRIKLSDYILEQSISVAEVNDILLEQSIAEAEVSMAICEAYMKQMDMNMINDKHIISESFTTNLENKKGVLYHIANFYSAITKVIVSIITRFAAWVSEKKLNSLLKNLEKMSPNEREKAVFYLPFENIDETYQQTVAFCSKLIHNLTNPDKSLKNLDNIDFTYELSNILASTDSIGKIDFFTREKMSKYTYDQYYTAIKSLKDAVIEKKSEFNNLLKAIKKNPSTQLNISDEKEAKKAYKSYKRYYSILQHKLVYVSTQIVDAIKRGEKQLADDIENRKVDETPKGAMSDDPKKFDSTNIIERRTAQIISKCDKCAKILNSDEVLSKDFFKTDDAFNKFIDITDKFIDTYERVKTDLESDGLDSVIRDYYSFFADYDTEAMFSSAINSLLKCFSIYQFKGAEFIFLSHVTHDKKANVFECSEETFTKIMKEIDSTINRFNREIASIKESIESDRKFSEFLNRRYPFEPSYGSKRNDNIIDTTGDFVESEDDS